MSARRRDAIPAHLLRPFPNAVPEFIVEVTSPPESLAETQRKMEEYIENGVLPGWLVDRERRTVYIHRPGRDVKVLVGPTVLAADPELPGFIANIERVFPEIKSAE